MRMGREEHEKPEESTELPNTSDTLPPGDMKYISTD